MRYQASSDGAKNISWMKDIATGRLRQITIQEGKSHFYYSTGRKRGFSSHNLLGFRLRNYFLVPLLSWPVNQEIPSFIPVTTANRVWQKMSHLDSPADKRFDILTTGILSCCPHNIMLRNC